MMVQTVMMTSERNYMPMKDPLSLPPQRTPLLGMKKAEAIMPQNPAEV